MGCWPPLQNGLLAIELKTLEEDAVERMDNLTEELRQYSRRADGGGQDNVVPWVEQFERHRSSAATHLWTLSLAPFAPGSPNNAKSNDLTIAWQDLENELWGKSRPHQRDASGSRRASRS